jgi:hypothetical protein
MFKIGKKVKAWIAAADKLEEIYLEKGITSCELKFDGCWGDNALHFAHRYKRRDPRCKHTFKSTILACNPCHMKIEYDKQLTEEVFKLLR